MIFVYCKERVYETDGDINFVLKVLAEREKASWVKIGEYIFQISEIEAIRQTK